MGGLVGCFEEEETRLVFSLCFRFSFAVLPLVPSPFLRFVSLLVMNDILLLMTSPSLALFR